MFCLWMRCVDVVHIVFDDIKLMQSTSEAIINIVKIYCSTRSYETMEWIEPSWSSEIIFKQSIHEGNDSANDALTLLYI